MARITWNIRKDDGARRQEAGGVFIFVEYRENGVEIASEAKTHPEGLTEVEYAARIQADADAYEAALPPLPPVDDVIAKIRRLCGTA